MSLSANAAVETWALKEPEPGLSVAQVVAFAAGESEQ